jgi:hypothetical protein
MTDKNIIERVAFEAAMKEYFKEPDEFGHYSLDEGNLYWLWGKAISTYEGELKAENERLRAAWVRYKSDMRPETRNDFLRVASSLFDYPVYPVATLQQPSEREG